MGPAQRHYSPLRRRTQTTAVLALPEPPDTDEGFLVTYNTAEPVHERHSAGASPKARGCAASAPLAGPSAPLEGFAGDLTRVGPASGSAGAPATGAGGSRANSRSAQGRWSSQRMPTAAHSSSQPPPPSSPCVPSHGPYSAAMTCRRRAGVNVLACSCAHAGSILPSHDPEAQSRHWSAWMLNPRRDASHAAQVSWSCQRLKVQHGVASTPDVASRVSCFSSATHFQRATGTCPFKAPEGRTPCT